MTGVAYAVMGLGALIAIFGLFLSLIPIVGLPLMVIGGFVVWIGQLLRRKAREQAVNRQLGG